MSIGLIAATAVSGDASAISGNTGDDRRYDEFPIYMGDDLGCIVSESGTHFTLWTPEADEVNIQFYDHDLNTPPVSIHRMTRSYNGTWRFSTPVNIIGKFYTFRVRYDGKWLDETPGPWARAVGTNGQRAAVIDLSSTDPEGWDADRGPWLDSYTDAVIYEMHHRDFSIHPSSNIVNKGKFISLAEPYTTNDDGLSTGVDHLKELGITHVQLMPSADFGSIDESRLDMPQYNWGYDPVCYNVPEGSYSTNPASPKTRITEMKHMIKTLHDAGIGVIMDVVYNHTAHNSPFELTAPGYYYRPGANGSGCGNEVADERPQVSHFIIESLKYWMTEYHVDGFRFDLMGLHDRGTMIRIEQELRAVRPDVILYGEGWTAGDSPLPVTRRTLKDSIGDIPGIAVFNDDLRDAVKGYYNDAADKGFVQGKPGLEEAVRIGIVGATDHPQVDYRKGIKSYKPYAASPCQVINYVSCHDNLMLTDKLTASMPASTEEDRLRAHKLAMTIVMTSQGVPFIFSGEEMSRTKHGDSDSYCSPDSINAIDWNLKTVNTDLVKFYCQLISLRRKHPAFRMSTSEEIIKNLRFDKTNKPNLISYSINNHANGDYYNKIKVILNGSPTPYDIKIGKGDWNVLVRDGVIDITDTPGTLKGGGSVTVEPFSALILAQ